MSGIWEVYLWRVTGKNIRNNSGNCHIIWIDYIMKSALVPSQNFTFIGMEFLKAKFSRGTSGPSRDPNSDYPLMQTSISMNFPFSFGQTSVQQQFLFSWADFTYVFCKCAFCLSGDLIFLLSVIQSRLPV